MTWNELFQLQQESEAATTRTTTATNTTTHETAENRLILVDVRTDPEFEVSTIPGAVSLRQFEEDMISSIPSNTKVVRVYYRLTSELVWP